MKKLKPKAKPETTQDPERTTITQSVSFDWLVYELMEAARKETRIPTKRSVYIREALEEKLKRDGKWHTKGVKP